MKTTHKYYQEVDLKVIDRVIQILIPRREVQELIIKSVFKETIQKAAWAKLIIIHIRFQLK